MMVVLPKILPAEIMHGGTIGAFCMVVPGGAVFLDGVQHFKGRLDDKRENCRKQQPHDSLAMPGIKHR